jgi:RimJ/RimL family protein N-acetyltransferase
MMADQDSTFPLAKFTIETALRDGTPVRMRPVQPDDKHLLEVGMEHLSKESRHFRFFGPVSVLSEKLLGQFTEIDHVNHEAVGALDIGGTPANPIGVVRYIRMPEQQTTAEVAVTVVDSHQGKGLGTLLLAFLAYRATENGITEFAATVLSENHRMLKLLRELGASTKFGAAGEVDIRVPLFVDATLYPQTPVGEIFRQISEMLTANR